MTRAHPPLSGFVLGLVLALLLGFAAPPADAAQPEPGPPPARTPTPVATQAAGTGGLDRREVWGYDGTTFIANGYRWYPGGARTTAFLRQLGLDRLAYDPKDDKLRGDFSGKENIHWGFDQFLYKFHGRMMSRDPINTAAASALADLRRINGGKLEGTGFAGAVSPYSSGQVPPGPERTDGRGVPGAGAAAGPGSTGAAGGGGLFGLPSPAELSQAVLGAIDWKVLLTGLLEGVYEVFVGDGVEELGEDLGLLLLATPDLRLVQGSLGNVHRLVDALRHAAMFLCIVVFTVTVVQFLLGNEQAPQAALGRLGVVIVGLGFYRELVGWLVRGSREITVGVFTVGADATTPAFTEVLQALVPAVAPFWYILALIGAVLLLAICIVKLLGFAFLLLTYAVGPLLLPLGIHPRTAPWVGVWAEHLVKVLLWPVLWALEFRLFGALAGGLTLVNPDGTVSGASLQGGALGALSALAMLVLMAGTPWVLHTRFTPRATVAGAAQVARRQLGRAADAAAIVVSGGAAVTVKGAVAHAVRTRAAGRARGAARSVGDRGEGAPAP